MRARKVVERARGRAAAPLEPLRASLLLSSSSARTSRRTTCTAARSPARLDQALPLEVLVRLAVVHVALVVLELLGELGVAQLGAALLLELLGDCEREEREERRQKLCTVREERGRGESESESERGGRGGARRGEEDARAMASSMRVISWKCFVLGRPRARMPNAWRDSWKCRSKFLLRAKFEEESARAVPQRRGREERRGRQRKETHRPW